MIKNELSTWMSKLKNVDHVGPFLVFYLPVSKLDKKSRSLVHDFFVENYNAYTHEISEINGYWVFKGELVEDKHERFEVSFKGIENFKKSAKSTKKGLELHKMVFLNSHQKATRQ